MRSEIYLTSLLRVLYALSNSNSRLISQSDFRKIAGIYYEAIGKELFDNDVVLTQYPRPLRCSHDSRLLRYIEQTEIELENLKKREVDRNLDNDYKKQGIRYGKLGFRLSLVAIILSAIAISIEILKLLRCSE